MTLASSRVEPSASSERTIRVLSYPNTHRNPYFRLFYDALAPYGVTVSYTNSVADMLVSGGKPGFDVLHLHWSIEALWRHGRSRRERVLSALRWWKLLRSIRKAGVRIVWTAHEVFPPQGGGWLDVVGYALCGMHCDLCICHSTLSRRMVARRCFVPPGRTITIPIGTYAGVVPPARDRAITNERFGLSPRSRLLVCFGDLRPRKGVEIAIRAAWLLGEPYELVVVGEAPSWTLKPWVESLRQRYPSKGNVRVEIGRLEDQALADLLGAADCVLLPYLEIFASSTLSLALALGRGVVASDLPYFREVLSLDPDAGVLTAPGDPEALARAVQAFFEKPVEVRHEAARRLGTRLTWDKLIPPVANWFASNGSSTALHR